MNTVEFLDKVKTSLADAEGYSVASVDEANIKMTLAIQMGNGESVNYATILANTGDESEIVILERTVPVNRYQALCDGFQAEVDSHYSRAEELTSEQSTE